MEEMKIEVVPNAEVLATLVGTEIDKQISTAKAFPRDIEKALANAERIALMSQGIAESCNYALARKQLNEKTGQYENKIIQGPSVRLAEIVTSQWGNMRSGARVISNDGRFITAQGFCHDLESNNFIAIEVKRKITNKHGKTFTEDMQVVTGNAACKIAFRNAVFTVIPAALVSDIYEKVLIKSKGTEKTLEERRNAAMKWFSEKDVTPEQIFETLGVTTLEEIDLEKLQILVGMASSIKNGEFSKEDLFPDPDEKKNSTGKEKADQSLKNTMDELTKKDKNKQQ